LLLIAQPLCSSLNNAATVIESIQSRLNNTRFTSKIESDKRLWKAASTCFFFFLLRLYGTRLRLYNTYNTWTSMNI